jgi:hypothetical protein
MDNILTTSNVMFAIGIISLLFSIWGKVKNPQDALDKQVAVEREEVEGKAKILEQRVQWEKESTDKKFSEIAKRLDDAFALAQNHTHSVDVKVDMLIKTTNEWHLGISNKLTKLETLLEERKCNK